MKRYNEQLVELLEEAAEMTFHSMRDKEGEKFYYFSLLMDESMFPFASAWSYEALDKIITEIQGVSRNELKIIRLDYKWSPCDSPYCAYNHNEFFCKVDDFIKMRNRNIHTNEEFENEFNLRLNSMEEAMRRLDSKGFFGIENDRKNVVISAEVLPPDYTNTERVKRLNPEDTIQEWIEICAEPEE